jgi:hypothetical protein
MIMIYGWSTSPHLKRRAVHIGVEHTAQKSNLLVDRMGVTLVGAHLAPQRAGRWRGL